MGDRDAWKSIRHLTDWSSELRLTNKLDRSIELIWMNFEGEPVEQLKTVKVGASLKLPIWVGQTWRVVDSETKQVLNYFDTVPMPNEDLILTNDKDPNTTSDYIYAK